MCIRDRECRGPTSRPGPPPPAPPAGADRCWPRRPPFGHDKPAVIDDRDLFAEVLNLVELMAGEEHAPTRTGLFHEHLADGVDPRWVQSGQGLIQNEQFRSVHQRGGKLHPLLVPMGEGIHLAVRSVCDAEPLQPCSCRYRCVGHAHPVQSAEVSSCSPTSMAGYRPCSSGMYPKRRRSFWPTGAPFHLTVPESSSVTLKTARTVVVLPAPFGPRKPTTWPEGTEKERSSGAGRAPYLRVSPSSSKGPLSTTDYVPHGRLTDAVALVARQCRTVALPVAGGTPAHARATCQSPVCDANHRLAEHSTPYRAVELCITEREDSPIRSNQAISGAVRRRRSGACWHRRSERVDLRHFLGGLPPCTGGDIRPHLFRLCRTGDHRSNHRLGCQPRTGQIQKGVPSLGSPRVQSLDNVKVLITELTGRAITPPLQARARGWRFAPGVLASQ